MMDRALTATLAFSTALAVAALSSPQLGRASELPVPPGVTVAAAHETPASISCTSPGYCTAVGRYSNRATTSALALIESSGKWRSTTEPVLRGSLNSVWCASRGNCVAVGARQTVAGYPQPVVVTERSGTWGRSVLAPVPGDASMTPDNGAGLASVSCSSMKDCVAVGNYTKGASSVSVGEFQGFLDVETSGTWSSVPISLPSDAVSQGPIVSRLSSVACSLSACMAVGGYKTSSGFKPMALTGSGTTWQQAVKVSLPIDALWGALDAVSCSTSSECDAAGHLGTSTGGQLWFTGESSGVWHASVDAVLPVGATPGSGDIAGMSCPAPNQCRAAASYSYATASHAQAWRSMVFTQKNGTWNRGINTAVPANAAPLPESVATSVSCVQITYCTILGLYTKPHHIETSFSVTLPSR